MSWDIRKKSVFDNISKESLELLEKSKISVYNLHVPLDNYSQYSTSVTFAKALNLKIVKLFMEYR
jgi:putative NIF3 family GTP cyclohydrolase 1 type 2